MMTRTKLSPAMFAYRVLGMDLYAWQIQALEAIGRQESGGKPVSARAANGSGKTSNLVAPAVLWFLSRYPKGQVVVTSGSFRQIEKQLWPAMRVHAHKFPGWKFLQTEIKTPEGGWALGFSTDDPGRAEGWHPKESPEIDPVFIIVDEAKTVPVPIFEAFDRCTRKFQLWVSSPGAPAGEFYDSHFDNSSLFYTKQITSKMCPHIDPLKRERDARRYGLDHHVYKSMHLAEFTENVERLMISKQELKDGIAAGERAEDQRQARLQAGVDPRLLYTSMEEVVFIDFAAGGDENVIAHRSRNTVKIVKAWHEVDTMQMVRECIRILKGMGIQPSQAWGDGDGLGIPIVQKFAEDGYPINSFRGGTAAIESDLYPSQIAEAWITGTTDIKRGVWHLPDLDGMTHNQLTTRFQEWDAKGRLRPESKEKMAKTGKKSPDRADALLGAIYCGGRIVGAISEYDAGQVETGGNEFAVDIIEI